MQFGLHLSSQHPATENMRDRLQELREQVRLAQAVGFHSIVAPQHYLPAPFQMLQLLPLLARMVAEAHQIRLIAGIMLLSLQNPIALAEDIGTPDAICNGQFTLGVALGYREPEFQAFGAAKADAVPRLIEVLTALKRLWTKDIFDHRGAVFHHSRCYPHDTAGAASASPDLDGSGQRLHRTPCGSSGRHLVHQSPCEAGNPEAPDGPLS